MIRFRDLGGPACLFLAITGVSSGQEPSERNAEAPTARPEERLLQALRTNPVTAPFAFSVARRDGKLALSGRVASGGVHDVAIQTALAMGLPVRDDLTIDTGLGVGPVGFFPTFNVMVPPPMIAFPPWFGSTVGRVPIDASTIIPAEEAGPAAQSGGVELTLDVLGVAVLRGVVASEEERLSYAREVAAVPGVTQVVNLLEIAGAPESNGGDEPPPPPRPFVPPPPEPELDPDAPAAIKLGDPLATKVAEAIARRPALKGAGIAVTVRNGVATLTGRVPTAYEAMLAFRAAQQTPGVREVDDRLSFDTPEEGRPNPLVRKARPEDLAPYLLNHARRQFGDFAHVDQITPRGDALEVTGTVIDANDVARAEATLRSIPLLRGFRLEPRFLPD